MNTLIEYMYRDGSNYKMWNKAIVSGILTEEQSQDIFSSCDDGEYFVPRQVGLPEERFDDVNNDDHCWFELQSIEDTEQEATVEIAASELHQKFMAASGNWDETAWMEGGAGL